MHLTSVAVLHTILVPLVAANCYKSGPDRVNQQFALDNIATAAGLLQGYQWYFSVQNTGSNGQAIGKGDIDKYLRQEVNGCGKNGGSSAHGSTRYTSDPNSGICIDTNYINDHDGPPKPPTRRGAVLARSNQPVFTDVSALVPQMKEQDDIAKSE